MYHFLMYLQQMASWYAEDATEENVESSKEITKSVPPEGPLLTENNTHTTTTVESGHKLAISEVSVSAEDELRQLKEMTLEQQNMIERLRKEMEMKDSVIGGLKRELEREKEGNLRLMNLIREREKRIVELERSHTPERAAMNGDSETSDERERVREKENTASRGVEIVPEVIIEDPAPNNEDPENNNSKHEGGSASKEKRHEKKKSKTKNRGSSFSAQSSPHAEPKSHNEEKEKKKDDKEERKEEKKDGEDKGTDRKRVPRNFLGMKKRPSVGNARKSHAISQKSKKGMKGDDSEAADGEQTGEESKAVKQENSPRVKQPTKDVANGLTNQTDKKESKVEEKKSDKDDTEKKLTPEQRAELIREEFINTEIKYVQNLDILLNVSHSL